MNPDRGVSRLGTGFVICYTSYYFQTGATYYVQDNYYGVYCQIYDKDGNKKYNQIQANYGDSSYQQTDPDKFWYDAAF